MRSRNTRIKQNYSKSNKNSEVNFPKTTQRAMGLVMHSEENNKKHSYQ